MSADAEASRRRAFRRREPMLMIDDASAERGHERRADTLMMPLRRDAMPPLMPRR